MGFNIDISYGDIKQEGNIAWGLKQNFDKEVVTGKNAELSASEMKEKFSYTEEQIQLILFLRKIEKGTRHKIEPPPGLSRQILRNDGLVD